MYIVTYTSSSYTIHTSIYCIFTVFINFSYIITQIKNICCIVHFFVCFNCRTQKIIREFLTIYTETHIYMRFLGLNLILTTVVQKLKIIKTNKGNSLTVFLYKKSYRNVYTTMWFDIKPTQIPRSKCLK